MFDDNINILILKCEHLCLDFVLRCRFNYSKYLHSKFCCLLLQALQFGIVSGPIGPTKNSTFCLPKQTLIEHSFEIATFVFFVAPMVLITVLYCLIGLTLRNASNVKESKLRLRKSLSNHKREVGQQRVLKMLGKSCIFPLIFSVNKFIS